MKIIRSRGTSFTTFETKDETKSKKPTRGLRPFAGSGDDVQPSALVEHLKQDSVFSMRQVISALDKVIKKPSKLKYCPLEVYVDRTLLSEELWQLLRRSINPPVTEKMRDTWNSKVHPYAKAACDTTMPEHDKNGKKTVAAPNAEAGDKTRDDFRGRWHKTHWTLTANGKPDYRKTAEAIFEHLHTKEMKIGKGKRKRKSVDEFGLNDARSKSIVASANDPRLGKAAAYKELVIDEVIESYFRNEVVETIHSGAIAAIRNGVPWRGSDFGRLLFENFEKLKLDPKPEPLSAEQQKTEDAKWALHSKVRTFYQKIARSEKFQRAVTEGNFAKVAQILPENAEALLTQINVRHKNAKTSELIRLGKLIVHASDIPADIEDACVNTAFQKRMEHFATSEGQSEIKRNEAFTRVWRNAVGQTTQTLRAWVDPDSFIWNPGTDDDGDLLGSTVVSKSIYRELGKKLEITRLQRHTQLIFGNKDCFNEGSRATILTPRTPDDTKEMVWTLLRIAGEIRNRTNHFNTRKRLQALIVEDIVKTGDEAIDNRPSFSVAAASLERLASLLTHDIKLQKQVIVDGLNRLKVQKYLTVTQVADIISEISQDDAAPEIVTPKFITLLRHTHNIAKNHLSGNQALIGPFAALDLVALGAKGRDFEKDTMGEDAITAAPVVAPTIDPINECRIGLLRFLYNSGFETWLSDLKPKPLETAIIYAKSATQHRKDQFAIENSQFYKSVDDLTDELHPKSLGKLVDLLNALLAQSAALDKAHTTYQSDSEKQKRQTDRFGKFKLDLFGSLFAQYLEEGELTWIWGLSALNVDCERLQPLTTDTIPNIGWQEKPAQWQANFYAWLYLVPTDQVALLRHQFRKTAALEYKSTAENDVDSIKQFKTIDRLMALHVAVHEAGFSGVEHYDDGFKAALYENPKNFDAVYSNKEEDHKTSFPGTRRGLRQLQRFGHYKILKSTFEKHKITNDEVENFIKIDSAEVQGYLATRKSALAEIDRIRLENSKLRPDRQADQIAALEKTLGNSVEQYRTNVTALMIHKFVANGARLTEFANLHHLMMRVVGRLLDFTLLWERDSHYYFLGLLYKRLSVTGGGIASCLRVSGKNTTLTLPGDMKWVPRDRNGNPELATNILPLWKDRFGFSLPPPIAIECLLDETDREQFLHWFHQATAQDDRDKERATKKRPPPAKFTFDTPRKQIRNDFAHYNVINGKKNRINPTYLTNAVRSLFGYDRKLKNAVSNAIADIVAEEGLVIEWEMLNGRLKKPSVSPAVERHLTMIKGPLGQELQFGLPQASVRYTSMVKALFDFDSGGNRELVPGTNKRGDPIVEAIGPLHYPVEFKEKNDNFVPADFYEITYPALPPPAKNK